MGADIDSDPQPQLPDLVEVPKNWAIFCDSVTDNFRVSRSIGSRCGQ
jgi:hypothetical protein